jgi:hypothetical protein
MAWIGKICALTVGVVLVLFGLGLLRFDASGFEPSRADRPAPVVKVSISPSPSPSPVYEKAGETVETDSISDSRQIELLTERVYQLEQTVDLICQAGVYTNQNGQSNGAMALLTC